MDETPEIYVKNVMTVTFDIFVNNMKKKEFTH